MRRRRTGSDLCNKHPHTVNQMYNTNIVLKRNLGKKALFSGSIRYDETLDDVLDKICFSLNLTIETHNEQIIIH